MNKTILKCNYCENEFKRDVKEHNRSIRLGRKEYCSCSCVGKVLNKKIEASLVLKKKRTEHIRTLNSSGISGKNNDEYSPFRRLMSSIRTRCKNKGIKCPILIEDLKELWDRQKGRCFYSGTKMILPKNSGDVKGRQLMKNCSVDRIDSDKPYQKDNIVLCCYGANLGKGIWSGEEYIDFCKTVSKYHGGAIRPV